jgi:hypothetical protein
MSTRRYKLPKCFLGKTMQIISDNPANQERVITEADVEMDCRCLHEMQAFFCDDGHMTECHVGMSCAEAQCSHLAQYDSVFDEEG